MDKQMSLSAFSDELSQVRTRKKEFLSQIERLIPWSEWGALIQPSYYKGDLGNKPYGLELMLRIYLLQNLYDMSDEKTVAEVIDSRAFSDFCARVPISRNCSDRENKAFIRKTGKAISLYLFFLIFAEDRAGHTAGAAPAAGQLGAGNGQYADAVAL